MATLAWRLAALLLAGLVLLSGAGPAQASVEGVPSVPEPSPDPLPGFPAGGAMDGGDAGGPAPGERPEPAPPPGQEGKDPYPRPRRPEPAPPADPVAAPDPGKAGDGLASLAAEEGSADPQEDSPPCPCGPPHAAPRVAASSGPSPVSEGADPTGTVAAATALFLPLLAFWLLGRRVTARNALDSPARRHLYELLQRYPGLRMAQLAKLAGLSHSGVEHHVRLLVETGLVRAERTLGGPRYHAAGPVHRDHAAIAARDLAFSATPAQALLELVESRPGIGLSEASRALDCSPSHVHYHVQRLATLGLVASEKVAGIRRLYPRSAR